MVGIIKFLKSITPGSRPASRTYGEPYFNFGDNQFGGFDSSNVARDLIGVPFFSSSATYAAGQPVNNGGKLYVANTAISAGAFNSTQWYQVTSGIIAVVRRQVFTTVGSSTYTPNANMVNCIMECLAGGGAGGGAGSSVSYILIAGGGGAGAYSRTYSTKAAVGASQPVTVGVGGPSGVAGGAPGQSGGDSSVGSLCLAKGGGGGNGILSTGGGAGGSGGSGPSGIGDLRSTGGSGGGGFYLQTTTSIGVYNFAAGQGSNSTYGGGGFPGLTASANSIVNGNGGIGFGAGGGGCGANQYSGGNGVGGPGSQGFVIVTEFCSA
jgi:hypothetical protein